MSPQFQELVRGVLAPAYLLDYLRFFVLFEDDGTLVKKIAGYHQFHAVRAAISEVVQASRPGGSHKGGVVWHTQGAGKSLAAKCVAGAWQLPLYRLDFGALYQKYHGETERNVREALAVANAMAPCVLWMDEIEKGVAGDAGGESDGGVSRRVLGTLLTWMKASRSVLSGWNHSPW